MRHRVLVVLLFMAFVLGFSLAAVGDDGKVVGTWCSLCGKLIPAGRSCRHMRGGSSSFESSGGNEVSTYDPVAAQHAEGHNLNEAGIRFYNEKNWAKAVEYFENAVRKWPENMILQKNLENAKDALRQEIAEKERQQKEIERQQKEAQTAGKMRGSISQFSNTLNNQRPLSSSGLDFDGGKAAAPLTSTGLDFMTAPTPGKAITYIGQLGFMRGEFSIENRDGSKLTNSTIQAGGTARIDIGTRVTTGSTGHLQILLLDETVFTIGPNSDIVIDEFVYDPNLSIRVISARVLKGIFRWVTGKVTHKDPAKMKVSLPVAAIGIRGTDFETKVAPDGSGHIKLFSGELEITSIKNGSTFILKAKQMIRFNAAGIFGKPEPIHDLIS
jgi:hypothetical protein